MPISPVDGGYYNMVKSSYVGAIPENARAARLLFEAIDLAETRLKSRTAAPVLGAPALWRVALPQDSRLALFVHARLRVHQLSPPYVAVYAAIGKVGCVSVDGNVCLDSCTYSSIDSTVVIDRVLDRYFAGERL